MSEFRNKSAARAALTRNVEGVELLGELVTWSCGGVRVTYARLIQALKEAGLDHAVARRMLPRNAFKRACKELSASRVIREVRELSTASELVFQFTLEKLENQEFRYETEDLVSIHRETGQVACRSEELRDRAQALLDAAVEARTGSDVTRIIQRLFEQHADLFPVRDRGGIYFCPIAFKEFVDRIAKFMAAMSGTLDRWPVPAGLASSKKSVKESIDAGITRAIEDHLAAIDEFNESTRADTFDRHQQAIAMTGMKIEAYKSLLEDKVEGLDRALARAGELLRAKMAGEFSAVDRLFGLMEEEAPEEAPEVQDAAPEADDWVDKEPTQEPTREEALESCVAVTQQVTAPSDSEDVLDWLN